MRLRGNWKPWTVPLACIVIFFVLRALVDRTGAFRAQAKAGQPIVRAIESYRKQTGNYPTSLVDVVPKYLETIPDMPDESHQIFNGWDYQIVTNHAKQSYSLRYYMGRGGVEYKPPVWYGNDEGTRTVILKNE
jgi:hypothetical protein